VVANATFASSNVMSDKKWVRMASLNFGQTGQVPLTGWPKRFGS
jgi:hypothetical protein